MAEPARNSSAKIIYLRSYGERDREDHDVVDRVLDVTVELLRDVAFADLSTRGIADRAGVSHGEVCAYFRSKDAIVAEDMAKFPELNLAESLQRLPGALAQLQRRLLDDLAGDVLDRRLQQTRAALETLVMPEVEQEELQPSTGAFRDRAQTYVVLGAGLLVLAASLVIGFLLMM